MESIMELDELKAAWQTLDRRLQQQNSLALHLLRDGRIGRMRSTLRPLLVGQWLQLTLGAAIVVFAAWFWSGHRQPLHSLVSGLLLQVYGMAILACSARELVALQAIDYAAPVLGLQRQLGALRAWHVRSQILLGAIGCLGWVPLVLVQLQVLYGVDLWSSLPRFVFVLVASGLAGLLLLCALLIVFAQWPQLSICKRMEQTMVGRSLGKAQAELDEIVRFEQERG